MDKAPLTFKEMCARFDVTPRTLRYYEYIELLRPERDGRARFYGPREVARMTLILRGRRYGFSLEEIRQWLEIYDTRGGRAQMVDLVERSDRQIAVLEEQQAELARTIAELRAMRDQVAADLGADMAAVREDDPAADPRQGRPGAAGEG